MGNRREGSASIIRLPVYRCNYNSYLYQQWLRARRRDPPVLLFQRGRSQSQAAQRTNSTSQSRALPIRTSLKSQHSRIQSALHILLPLHNLPNPPKQSPPKTNHNLRKRQLLRGPSSLPRHRRPPSSLRRRIQMEAATTHGNQPLLSKYSQ